MTFTEAVRTGKFRILPPDPNLIGKVYHRCDYCRTTTEGERCGNCGAPRTDMKELFERYQCTSSYY